MDHIISTIEIPDIIRDSFELLVFDDAEWTQKEHFEPPQLGLSSTKPALLPRDMGENILLSHQWIAVSTRTGKMVTHISLRPTERFSLGDILRIAGYEVGFTAADFNPQGKDPQYLRALKVHHWGSAEIGILKDRDGLMGKGYAQKDKPHPEIIELGGGVVSLGATKMPIPMRDASDHYGMVYLTILDTFRLTDVGSSLDKIGQEMGLPKIDIAPYTKDRMDIFLDEAPERFAEYAMRDCEIAAKWAMKSAELQKEKLGLDHIAVTTGGAAANGLIQWYEERHEATKNTKNPEPTFNEAFQTEYSHARKEFGPSKLRNENESYITQCFAGGMNQSYQLGRVEGDIIDLDLSGAYLGAMGVLPGIDWSVDAAKEEKDPWKLTDLLTFVGVKFRFPAGTQFPCIPVWTEKHGLIFPLSNWEQPQAVYITGVEVLEALRMECQVKVVSARQFKHRGLLVADYLKALAIWRSHTEKGTVENTTAKLYPNSLYGKMAQGLSQRCTNDELLSEDELDSEMRLPRHRVTFPHAAATITGLIRAVLGVLVREASKVGKVLSATTDGAMIRLNPGERETVLPLLIKQCETYPSVQLFMEGLKNIEKDPTKWLEVKHEGTEASTIRTRVNWIGKGGQTVHEARTGFTKDTEKPWYVPFSELEDVIRTQAKRFYNEPQNEQTPVPMYYTEGRLNKISDVMEGRAKDITNFYQTKIVNLTPDWKRKFNTDGTSRPFKSMNEYWQYRRVVDNKGWRAYPDLVNYMVKHGLVSASACDNALKRGILHRIALGVQGFRLPKGSTFKSIIETINAEKLFIDEKGKVKSVNPAALSKLRKERLGSSDFPVNDELVTQVQQSLGLW